ncbi:hypothetical protein KO495_00175 [Colwellia sp. D2M02]|nr:hypothetical protein [Colwellia sp. D2M02]MBU2891732.1 hypothetical protein [Colwellia sp. D2M02]
MNILSLMLILLLVLSSLSAFASASSPAAIGSQQSEAAHNAWLKDRFKEQHREIIPVVAVADIFFMCNKERKVDSADYSLSDLVTKLDRDTLAEKLILCLQEDTMQSDTALNFGLLGCFHEQLSHLPDEERQQKMQFVRKAINNLSHAERKKSFTQCVTEQAIHYLK